MELSAGLQHLALEIPTASKCLGCQWKHKLACVLNCVGTFFRVCRFIYQSGNRSTLALSSLWQITTQFMLQSSDDMTALSVLWWEDKKWKKKKRQKTSGIFAEQKILHFFARTDVNVSHSFADVVKFLRWISFCCTLHTIPQAFGQFLRNWCSTGVAKTCNSTMAFCCFVPGHVFDAIKMMFSTNLFVWNKRMEGVSYEMSQTIGFSCDSTAPCLLSTVCVVNTALNKFTNVFAGMLICFHACLLRCPRMFFHLSPRSAAVISFEQSGLIWSSEIRKYFFCR